MTEAELYAKIGKQHTIIEDQDAAYSRLLELLAGVVVGNIDRARVLVNLTDRSWIVSEPNTSPGTPATINGLPEIAVYREPEAVAG